IHQLQERISVRPITVCIRSIWDIKNHQTDSNQICTGFMCYDHHLSPIHIWFKLINIHLIGTTQKICSHSGFSVLHNSRQRKLTQLPYYIQIDQETTMSKVTDIGPIFPVHNFSPQNYKSLLRLATTPTYLPGKSLSTISIKQTWIVFYKSKQCADVVGQICMMQKTNQYHPEINTEVTVGLLLNSILKSKKNRKFKVVIFTSIIPKLFKGKLQLNSSPATKFYFNRSIEYIKHFKGRIKDQVKACSEGDFSSGKTT
ncbi:hypothetical protein HID58_071137, partial [Brassica napus]